MQWLFGFLPHLSLATVGLALVGFSAVVVITLLYLSRGLPTAVVQDGERIFFDPSGNKQVPFPSLFDEPTKELSIVIPAYNEQERLPVCLDEMLNWLTLRNKADPKFTFEIILVDDGSKDGTASVGYDYAKKFGSDTMRVLRVLPNGGKGNAVKKGMLVTRGRYVMFADADGASLFSDILELFGALKKVERDGFGVAVGSRNHLVRKAIATRKWYRNILMHGFHMVVYLLAVRTIKDTQCGFKLFTRRAAQAIFPNQHLPRWGFDVELLHIAERLHIPLAEVAVNWTEVPGSKLHVVGATLSISKDLLLICLNYALGLWKVQLPASLRSALPLRKQKAA